MRRQSRSARATSPAAIRRQGAARRWHVQARQWRSTSEGILGLGKRERRLRKDEEVEQHGPILDVIEIVLDPALDFLVRVGLPAPTADLRPAGDAGLDAMAGEIAVDRLVIEPVLGLGMNGVRARSTSDRLPLNTTLKSCGSSSSEVLTDKGARPGDARIDPPHQLRCRGVALVHVHRAELVDFDELVVEAMSAWISISGRP